jgi:hypothetical protein
MSRLRSLAGQSPAIAIATLALVLSFVGGATATQARPGHAISEITYASGGVAAAINIGTNGQVIVFDQTGTDSAVRDFTSFDGLTFSLG